MNAKFIVITLICTIALGLAGNYYQYIIAKELKKELTIANSEVDTLRTGLHEATNLYVDMKEVADYLKENPTIKWKTKLITRTIWDTVTVDSDIEVPEEILVTELFEDTLDYSGDKAMVFDNLVTEEGDSISFNIEQRIDLVAFISEDGNIFIDDTNRYWMKDLKLVKVNKLIEPSKLPKFALYGGIGILGDIKNNEINGLLNLSVTIDNKYIINGAANQRIIYVGCGYNFMSLFGL